MSQHLLASERAMQRICAVVHNGTSPHEKLGAIEAVVDDWVFQPVEPVCQDCNQLVAEKQDLRDKLRSAYAVIAERQQRLEDDERNMRAARRQLELFMDDGIRERITVALALLDENVESRSEAWFDFTEQRGQ